MFVCPGLTGANIVVNGKNKKHGGHGGHALNDIGDGLGLDRAYGPEGGAQEGDEKRISLGMFFERRRVQQKQGAFKEKGCSENVDEEVDKVIAEGLVLAAIPIKGKRKVGDRAEEMAFGKRLGEECRPEGLRHQVVDMERSIIQYIGAVVKIPGACEGVGIEKKKKCCQDKLGEKGSVGVHRIYSRYILNNILIIWTRFEGKEICGEKIREEFTRR